MEYTYEIINNLEGNNFILRSDNAIIPMDQSNSDYQVYLKWVEEQEANK